MKSRVPGAFGAVLACLLCGACADAGGPGDTDGAGASDTAGSDDEPTRPGDDGSPGDPPRDDSPDDPEPPEDPGCEAPDMLLLLDRTMSMSRMPVGGFPPNTNDGRRDSRWAIAIAAAELVTSKLDDTIRFGLALFPRDPGDACVSLAERLDDIRATNPQCELGEVVVRPALGSANAVARSVDPEVTRLCRSTPIGPGLAAARAELAATRDDRRDQFVLLVTDGGDTCDVEASIQSAQDLARDGVETFVVGFGAGGNSHANLNNLACAGRTAAGFPAGCTDDGAGNFRAAAPEGETLYLVANDGSELLPVLEDVAGTVCCGCVE